MSMKDRVRRLRRWCKAALGFDVRHRAEINLPSIRLGSEYGGWVVHTAPLPQDAIVYSFGVGEDITFDLALIDQLGVCVHAFDPTPRSVAWIHEQRVPETFTFHPLGIAEFDGRATFSPPATPGHVSYSLAKRSGDAVDIVEADVRRLATIMRQFGHDRVDLLKLDIEGAEYGVIADMLSSRLDVRQLLVEFHHRHAGISVEDTRRAVATLREHGFKAFYVSPRGEEFSFIHRDLDGCR